MNIKERIKNLFRSENNISDGYHTFEELYDFRVQYNAAFFNSLDPKYDVHKSLCHSDGTKCFGGGWFIVVAELPDGQISNHYPFKYWNLFNIKYKKFPNKYDGHSEKDVLNRLNKFNLQIKNEY